MGNKTDKIVKNGYKFNNCAVFIILDTIMIVSGYFLALMARFNFRADYIPKWCIDGFNSNILFVAVSGLLLLWHFKNYHSIWRFASTADLKRLVNAFVAHQGVIAAFVVISHTRMPRTFWLVGAVLEFIGLALIRFSFRIINEYKIANDSSTRVKNMKRVMVIGAGSAGRILIREMRENPTLNMNPVCIIDDNKHVLNKSIDGISIVGTRDDIIRIADEYKIDSIIFAIPSASSETKKEILNICKKAPCKVKTVPGLYQLVDNTLSVGILKDVSLEDLLGRDPVKIDMEAIHSFVAGKTVMVTGGGGSIGSELCRQLAADDLKQLIIFDIYENNAYAIEMELRRKYPDLNLVALIGSVRDVDRVNDVFETYRPDIVYHAAAHKHVPLMETSPHEAIKNNVFGTYNVARAALKYKTQRMTLISTDKAVNPTNIMGASKRLCEMVIQMMDRKSLALGKDYPTCYTAVRFGNVLGSNGSVIPLFKKQIKEGGPVTVTDKRIVRYFMTIPEAVSLVLESSYYAHGGEIFVLDMGEPVKIDDMARNLIRLSGYEPDVDIQIVYTGLRPGEKLYEEMLMGEEGLKDTANKLIHVGEPIEMDDDKFMETLDLLYSECHDENSDIVNVVASVVPTYHPELGGK